MDNTRMGDHSGNCSCPICTEIAANQKKALRELMEKIPYDSIPQVTHLVVIAREGVPEVTQFCSFEDAARYFDTASMNWTESYLCNVIAGPGKPLNMTILPKGP